MAAPTMAPPDVRKLLETDPDLFRQLTGYTKKKTGSRSRTREVTQEAVARVLGGDGWYRWDPNRKDLVNHLMDVVDTIVANEDRRASVKREEPMARGQEERSPDSKPSPEQLVDAKREHEHKMRLAARVMERVDKDPIIPEMLRHEKEGVDKAADLAALLHCTVKDIYRARERLAHHRDKVLEEERKQEEKRVKGLALSP